MSACFVVVPWPPAMVAPVMLCCAGNPEIMSFFDLEPLKVRLERAGSSQEFRGRASTSPSERFQRAAGRQTAGG
jgi:hypothetical protein